MLKVQLLHPNATLPHYAHEGDGCFDLFSVEDVSWNYSNGLQTATVPLGLAFEIPVDYTMFVFSRSGHGFNYGITLANSTGVIDSTYRGEVEVKLTSHNRVFDIEKGTKVAQACVMHTPRQYFEIVQELSTSPRTGGFGSTGNK